jgi:signal transduction histidine kinase
MINESQEFIPRQFTLEEWNEREYELAEKTEELESQKEELNAAVEELIRKNKYLEQTLSELSKRKSELDQLVYRLSHDLRTPVTSIMGVCQIMRLEGIPQPFLFHLDHIQRKIVELDQVLKSLSAFAHVALEDAAPEWVRVDQVLRTALDSLSGENGFRQVTFEVSAPPLSMLSDSRKLHVVFRNILKNAIDFRSGDDSPRVSVSITGNDSELRFICHDNGIGILPDVCPHIFKMFYRGHERASGSGLGLYIVQQIVHDLKGSVSVESVPGNTSFRVLIPASVKQR